MFKIIFLVLILAGCGSQTLPSDNSVLLKPEPIQFSIPETKIVSSAPAKDTDFAYIITGQLSTYIYNDEASYYAGYQRAYYAVTMKKGGWDCMRHYEILANGSIPYFIDLDKAPEKTMFRLPRKLIQEAMNLPGVSYLKIDHNIFNKQRYFELLDELLEYTRKNLTTRSMAQYLLDEIGYAKKGKILFLSGDVKPDYLRCLTLIGLKEILGKEVVDYPKIEHIYKGYPGELKALYGKGISYSKIIDDENLDRDNIEQRIKTKEFEIVIYGSVHRGIPYHDLVHATYPDRKIIYLDGEDFGLAGTKKLPNLFLREFPEIK